MVREPRIVKCPICEEPYKFYPFKAGDQSACPDCRRKTGYIWEAYQSLET